MMSSKLREQLAARLVAVHRDHEFLSDLYEEMNRLSEAAASNATDSLTTAMCLWEEVLTHLRATAKPGNKWMLLCEEHGTWVVRDRVAQLADPCDKGWLLLLDGGGPFFDSFDWDYVPRFLDLCVDEHCLLKDDWQQILVNLKTGEK